MNLLVISDLHIGVKDRFDTFGWQIKHFIDVLEHIVAKHNIQQVILNGDIFELYHNTFEQVYQVNSELVDYLKQKKYIFIKGNHDALSTLGYDSYIIENSKGQQIYIEHGHNADFLNGTKLGRCIGRFGFRLLKFFTKYEFVLKQYFKTVERNDYVNRIPKKYDSYTYLRYALNLLKHYDAVILGHTHKIEVHKTYYLNNKKVYLNTGSCSLHRFQGVIIETETLIYETIKLSKKKLHKKFGNGHPTPLGDNTTIEVNKILKPTLKQYLNTGYVKIV